MAPYIIMTIILVLFGYCFYMTVSFDRRNERIRKKAQERFEKEVDCFVKDIMVVDDELLIIPISYAFAMFIDDSLKSPLIPRDIIEDAVNKVHRAGRDRFYEIELSEITIDDLLK